MFRRFNISHLVACALAAFSVFLFQSTVDTYLLMLTLAALIAVARLNPAPFRSFWRRVVARTRDPVPSTI